MSSINMLCLVFIIIAAQSIRACPRSPPLGNLSKCVNGVLSSSLKYPNYFIGIQCFGCEFDSNDVQHNIEHPSKFMPNCAYDYLYGFGEKAKNVSYDYRCNSCVKANVYLKGNIIFPQHNFLKHLNHRSETLDPTRLLWKYAQVQPRKVWCEGVRMQRGCLQRCQWWAWQCWPVLPLLPALNLCVHFLNKSADKQNILSQMNYCIGVPHKCGKSTAFFWQSLLLLSPVWKPYREANKGFTWLREISACSCLTVLPGPAWVLLGKTCKPLFTPL